MSTRVVRHAVIGVALVAVAGIATANTLGYVGAPTGTAYVELLDGAPVLRGDLGEIVVIGTRAQDAPLLASVRDRR